MSEPLTTDHLEEIYVWSRLVDIPPDELSDSADEEVAAARQEFRRWYKSSMQAERAAALGDMSCSLWLSRNLDYGTHTKIHSWLMDEARKYENLSARAMDRED